MKTAGREAFIREWRVFRDNRVSCFVPVVTFRTQSQRRIWSHYSFFLWPSECSWSRRECVSVLFVVFRGKEAETWPCSRSQLVSNQWETVMAHWKLSCRRPSWRESFLKNSLSWSAVCQILEYWLYVITWELSLNRAFPSLDSFVAFYCGILVWKILAKEVVEI